VGGQAPEEKAQGQDCRQGFLQKNCVHKEIIAQKKIKVERPDFDNRTLTDAPAADLIIFLWQPEVPKIEWVEQGECGDGTDREYFINQ
jgi:hypothetical protein